MVAPVVRRAARARAAAVIAACVVSAWPPAAPGDAPVGSAPPGDFAALLAGLDATPLATASDLPLPTAVPKPPVEVVVDGQIIVFEHEPELERSGTRSWRSESGVFSLPLGPRVASGGEGAGTKGLWAGDGTLTGVDAGADIKIQRAPDGSWLRGRVLPLSRFGLEGALRAEAAYAKELVEAGPGQIITDVSLETYRASQLHCGTRRRSPSKHACSLVHVVVHDGRTIRLHSLILGGDRAYRDALVGEFVEVLKGLTVHSP